MTGSPVQRALRAYAAQLERLKDCPLDACAIAFSGGVDSSALLFAWADLLARTETAPPNAALHVLHVHHGLQAAADAFATHCIAVIDTLKSQVQIKPNANLQVNLHVIHAPVAVQSGQSTEEQARNTRYLALAAKAQQLGVSKVLLAQHADDQVETLLLALSRGAGLPGLAAMPRDFTRHGMAFARPLLEVPRADLQAYVHDSGIKAIEDPTNNDEAYTRNRLRAKVLPALEAALPQFRQTFARSARHAFDAQQLLDEIAQDKLALVVSSNNNTAISIVAIITLSPAQQRNTLRYWLKTQHATQASAAQLDELLAQLASSQRHGAPRRLRLKVGRGFVVREADNLCFEGV